MPPARIGQRPERRLENHQTQHRPPRSGGNERGVVVQAQVALEPDDL
jgi:hypothetical protein